jgi:hypothetical protein
MPSAVAIAVVVGRKWRTLDIEMEISGRRGENSERRSWGSEFIFSIYPSHFPTSMTRMRMNEAEVVDRELEITNLVPPTHVTMYSTYQSTAE